MYGIFPFWLVFLLILNQNQQGANTGHQLKGGLLKDLVSFFLRTFDRARIGKAPMHAFRFTWIGWTRFSYPVTNSKNIVKRLACQLVDMLGSLLANINPQYSTGSHRKRMQVRWVASRTANLNVSSAKCTQDAFCHLRTGAILCAKKEYADWCRKRV